MLRVLRQLAREEKSESCGNGKRADWLLLEVEKQRRSTMRSQAARQANLAPLAHGQAPCSKRRDPWLR